MQRAAQAGALSASIAHEINQPLATVRLSVEQALELSRVGAQTAQLDPLLERIASENGRAAAIIATLRDIFGNRNNQPETRSLDAVVSAMCELMRRRAREQGVALQVETDAPVRLRVGAGELEHVVLNLLTNALDALRRARVADGRIQVSTAVRDGRALLRVRDNGPGVDPDMRTKLFDLLVGSSRNGLGLGLWLSRHILDRSGGSIEIDADDPHPGASFTVSLHLADPDGAGARPSL